MYGEEAIISCQITPVALQISTHNQLMRFIFYYLSFIPRPSSLDTKLNSTSHTHLTSLPHILPSGEPLSHVIFIATKKFCCTSIKCRYLQIIRSASICSLYLLSKTQNTSTGNKNTFPEFIPGRGSCVWVLMNLCFGWYMRDMSITYPSQNTYLSRLGLNADMYMKYIHLLWVYLLV